MRRVLLVPVLALVVLAPSGVQAAEDDLLVCDAPPEGTGIIAPNETHSSEPSSPQFDAEAYVENEGDGSGTVTDLDFQLDLYPATATDTATVTSTLNWEFDLNDWDLLLLDAEGNEIDASENFQFGSLEDPPTETVSSKLLHCSLFTIRIFNYQAVAIDDVDPLQLEVRTGAIL
jgi:hypothetical protein